MVQVINLVCNACHDEEGQTIPAVASRDIAFGGKAPRTLDLCARHNEEILVRLAKLLAIDTGPKTAGALSTRPSIVRQQEMWHCPVCKQDIRRGGAVLHLWRHTPAGRAPAQPKRCPDCPAVHPDPRGMARHRQNVHKWDGFQEALDAAMEAAKPVYNVGTKLQERAAAASQAARRRREAKAG